MNRPSNYVNYKVVIPKEIPNNTKSFNSCFFDDINDLYINKIRENNCPIMYIDNDDKKNIVLKHLSKIPSISQSLQDIILVYIKNTLDFYLDYYI